MSIDTHLSFSAQDLFRGPIGASVMRVAATSNDVVHLQRVCDWLALAYSRLADDAAGDHLLDLVVLSRDTVRSIALNALFVGVLFRLANAPADVDDDDNNRAGAPPYPRQPIEIFRLAMQFRFVDDVLAHVCVTSAMQAVTSAAADGRAEDVDSDALICVVAEYMTSLRQMRKTANAAIERDARVNSCDRFLRSLARSAQALLANAVAYYVVGKHESSSKRGVASENAGSLVLSAAELAVARTLTQYLDPITHGPTIECVADNVGIANIDGASRALRQTLFGGGAKKRKPLE